MIHYEDPVTALPGIGAKRAALLSKLGITTVYDLISHFPRAYEDRTEVVEIAELQENLPACFEATVISKPYTKLIRKGMEVSHVTVADSSGRLQLTFFNRKYAAQSLEYGETYSFFGTMEQNERGCGMLNPSFEELGSTGTSTRCILPVYPLTAGLNNKLLQKTVLTALENCLSELPDPMPPSVRRKYGLSDIRAAYRMIHMPESAEDIRAAKRRLAFDEFFIFSLSLSVIRNRRESETVEPMRSTDLSVFYGTLPFSLTDAQKNAISEIERDFRSSRPMNRLVQGDVGSGKTMVAAASAYMAARSGLQTAFLAPTEILAEQHFRTLSGLFTRFGIEVALLTGSTTPQTRREVLARLESGECSVVVGTHALMSDPVIFRNLRLVIADEQHRFGVAQREQLRRKGSNPHVLVMSATPIPRTLSLVLYGDLDVSVLNEKPAGRKEVLTYLVNETMRKRINAFIRKQVEQGHQVFIVCPAVEEAEGNDLKSVETWAETLQTAVFPDLKVLFLHGKLKGTEKERIMGAFSRHEADILVATTVIEVGVDVSGATLMVIENAERFGLSQLHQLRGRVGRNDAQAYCVLFTSTKNPDSLARMKTFASTSDGFAIAEADLSLRGPGDFLGQRQSGAPMFRTGFFLDNTELMLEAKEAAEAYSDAAEEYPGRDLLEQRIERLLSDSDSLN